MVQMVRVVRGQDFVLLKGFMQVSVIGLEFNIMEQKIYAVHYFHCEYKQSTKLPGNLNTYMMLILTLCMITMTLYNNLFQMFGKVWIINQPWGKVYLYQIAYISSFC